MLKTKLVTVCCLFGLLSTGQAGWAEKWIPEEDEVVVEFIRKAAAEECIIIIWPYCADAVNAFRSKLRLPPTRTAEACRDRWDHFIKKAHPDVAESCKCRSWVKSKWTEDEDRIFLEVVEKHRSGGRIDWKGVAQDVGRGISVAQCRKHYKVLERKGLVHMREGLPREETLEIPDQEPNNETFFEEFLFDED
jgi:hypothetical protein